MVEAVEEGEEGGGGDVVRGKGGWVGAEERRGGFGRFGGDGDELGLGWGRA